MGQDITPPDTPILDSVSVIDPVNGDVIVSWFPCDSVDVESYVIYRSVNTFWQQIAVVPAPATSYVDNLADGNYHPELYRIAARDFAGNISPMTAITPIDMHHNTIYVFPYQDSINCQMAIRLSWNKYVYWSEGVNNYEIFVSENYGPWSLLTTVPGNTSIYYHETINDNTSYCYFIRGVSNSDRTSTSNHTCFYTNLPNLPQYINADFATVAGDGKIDLSFTLDTSANVRNYRLYRSESRSGIYTIINTFQNYNNVNLSYSDYVNTDKRWYYKLVSFNNCGNDVLASNIASNITIKVISNDDLTEMVSWDSYYDWLGDVESYHVYRIVDDWAPVLAGTVMNGDTTFMDDVSEYAMNRTGASGKFCYYVEAVEGSTNPYGIQGRSISNKYCSFQFDRVFIPQAFTPNGDDLNAEYLPIISFVRPDKYEFLIFDRWGNKLFETNDRLKGWDGKIKGRNAQMGTYVYLLRYLRSNDELFEKTGFLYLFYP